MGRCKEYDYSQGKFIPIHLDRQILPVTFEYSLHYLIDNEIDLSLFDLRYRNDETGAPAYAGDWGRASVMRYSDSILL
jgi:hypothetical protein